MAAPRLLIDFNRLPRLDFIVSERGDLRLGALTRWYQMETSDFVGARNPLLKQAVRFVAHHQIRNCGTLGGSCAHAGPAAELAGVLVACDADAVLRSETNERVLSAAEFFRGALDTALSPDEMIIELRFPAWPRVRRWGFEEFARHKSDFAIAGVAALVDQDAALEVSPSPLHPLGFKGAGEGGIVPVAAAIGNAVSAALNSWGVEIRETPIAPGRPWQLIENAKAVQK